MPPKTKRKLASAQAQNRGQPSKKPRRLTAKSRRKKGQPQGLLGLPIELRYLIFEFCIASHDDFRIKFKNSQRTTMPFFQKFTLPSEVVDFMAGMFSVNKQLNAEATEFFYSKHFKFDDIIVMQTFLLRGPRQPLSQIRHMSLTRWERVVMYEDPIRATTFALLDRLSSLRTFQFPDDFLGWNRRKLLPTRPNETLSHAIGKTLAAMLYRYAYPYLGLLIDDGGIEKLNEAVRISDRAFCAVNSTYLKALEPEQDDSPEEQLAKQKELKKHIQEARNTMMKLIVKLHLHAGFRQNFLKSMPGGGRR